MCFNPSVVLYSSREATAEWKCNISIQKMTCSKVQNAEQHQPGAFPGWKRASSGDSVALNSTRKWHPCHFLVAYAFSCWMHSAIRHLLRRDEVGAALCLATCLVDRMGILPCAQLCEVALSAPKQQKPKQLLLASFSVSEDTLGVKATGEMKKEK